MTNDNDVPVSRLILGSSCATPLVLRSEALRTGWTDSELRRHRRSGEISRIRSGAYAGTAQVAELDLDGKHRLLVQAAAAGSPSLVVSHVSAAALWTLPLWGIDLSRAQFTRAPGGGGRVSRDRHDHSALLDPSEVTVVDGISVTSVARTLVDLARTGPSVGAIVAADAALHRRLVTPEQLRTALARVFRQAGVGQARRALGLADGRSESPGESRTRVDLYALGVTDLDCQVLIHNQQGVLVGRVDLGCEEAMLLIEFDGLEKCIKFLKPGQTMAEAIMAEKEREECLRELGYLVVRLSWSDLHDPQRLLKRITAALTRGRALRAAGHLPVGTYTPLTRIGL